MRRLESQLLLTFDRVGPSTSGADGGGSVGRYSSAAESAEFRAALEAFARDNPLVGDGAVSG